MLNFKFDFDARKFVEDATDAVRRDFAEKVGRVRCPEHHQAARVRFTGGSGSKLECSIMGCCDKLAEAVKKALA